MPLQLQPRKPQPQPGPQPETAPPPPEDDIGGWPDTKPPVKSEQKPQDDGLLSKIKDLEEKLGTAIKNRDELQILLGALKGDKESLLTKVGDLGGKVGNLGDLITTFTASKDGFEKTISSLKGDLANKDGHILGLTSQLEDAGKHPLDDSTGGYGNTVENTSFIAAGVAIPLAIKYGPTLLGVVGGVFRRRKSKKVVPEEVVPAYNTNVPFQMPNTPKPQPFLTQSETDRLPGYVEIPDYTYGRPAGQLGFAPVGLPPQMIGTPFHVRKKVSAEVIMTEWGKIQNEYRDDRTMTTSQMDILLRQRLKENHGVE